MMDKWIELEPTFLTDQPMIYCGKGRSRKRVPDPDRPPKEAFLFIWRAVRGSRGIKRTRGLERLGVTGDRDLAKKLSAYIARQDVVLIDDPPDGFHYSNYRGEPRLAPAGE